MSLSSTYAALLLNGLIIASSLTSVGMPSNLNSGEINLHSTALKPLVRNSSMAINMAIIYGSSETIKGTLSFAPLTKLEYASTFLINEYINTHAIKVGSNISAIFTPTYVDFAVKF